MQLGLGCSGPLTPWSRYITGDQLVVSKLRRGWRMVECQIQDLWHLPCERLRRTPNFLLLPKESQIATNFLPLPEGFQAASDIPRPIIVPRDTSMLLRPRLLET